MTTTAGPCCGKLFDTLLFSVQFSSQSGNSFFHLCRIVIAILQLCLQFCNLRFVFFHLFRDEFDVRSNLLLSTGRVFSDGSTLQVNTAFSSIDLTETFLNFIESPHHIIQFSIALVQFHQKRIIFSFQVFTSTFKAITRSQQGYAYK